MNNVAREALKQIIVQYGSEVYQDARRCEAFLRDFAGAHKREIFVLVSALQQGVVGDLQTLNGQVPTHIMLAQVTAELRDALALNETAARWAVESWAIALGLLPDVSTSTPEELANNIKLIRLWDAHRTGVAAVAFDPAGGALASVGFDGVARLWDAADGQPQRQLRGYGHSGLLTSVAYRPDSKQLALGSTDGGVYLWDLDEPDQPPRRLQGHSGAVVSLAFSPEGAYLASGSADKSIWLWNAATGQDIRRLSGHGDAPIALAFSPGGQTLVSAGGWDRTVRLWDVSKGRELHKLVGHTAQVTTVAFSPDGATIASGGWDRAVRVWQTTTGRETHCLSEDGELIDLVFTLAYSPDGRLLATGGWDKLVRLWVVPGAGTASPAPPKLTAHEGHIASLAFSPDGVRLASAAHDGKIGLWQVG